MRKPKQCVTELMPDALLIGEDGAIREYPTVEGAPPGSRIVVTRYLIGVNVQMDDGADAFCPVTPYIYTFAAALKAYEENRKEYPNCAILWTNTAVDPTSEAQLAELAEMRAKWDEENATAGIQ